MSKTYRNNIDGSDLLGRNLTPDEVDANFRDSQAVENQFIAFIATINIANGFPGLDSTGKINASQLPPISVSNVYVVADQAARLALTGVHVGDVVKQTSPSGTTYMCSALPSSSLSNWIVIGATSILIADVTGLQAALDLKGNISDIINDLTHTDVNKPLSANQGLILKGYIDTLTTTVAAKVNVSSIVDDLLHNYSNQPLSANQGLILKGITDALTTSLAGKESLANKNAVSGYAGLDSSGKIATAQLPSYVDDVVEGYLLTGVFYSDSGHTIPITGETGKIYVDLTGGQSSKEYRWSGSVYIQITNGLIASADDVPNGSTNKYFTSALTLAVTLAGLSTTTNAVITSSDSILSALGKIQKQITDLTTIVNNKVDTSATTTWQKYAMTQSTGKLLTTSITSLRAGAATVAGEYEISDITVVTYHPVAEVVSIGCFLKVSVGQSGNIYQEIITAAGNKYTAGYNSGTTTWSSW